MSEFWGPDDRQEPDPVVPDPIAALPPEAGAGFGSPGPWDVPPTESATDDESNAGRFRSYVQRAAGPETTVSSLWGDDVIDDVRDTRAPFDAPGSVSMPLSASRVDGGSTAPAAGISAASQDPAVATFDSEHGLVAFPEQAPPSRRFTAAAALLLLGFPLLFLLGATVGRTAMERDLRRTSIRALQQKGYAKDVEVSFSGRDAKLTGSVETNAEVLDIARVVSARNGVRSVSKGGLKVARPDLVDTPAQPVGDSNGTPSTVANTGKPSGNDKKGGADTAVVDVSKLPTLEVKFHDGNLELRGNVADAKARDALLDRIGATFEKEAIISKLQLTGGKSSKADLAGYAKIGAFLADMPRLGVQDADLLLEKGFFTFNGRVTTAPDAKRVENAMIEVVGAQDRVKGRVSVSNRVGATSSSAADATTTTNSAATTVAAGALPSSSAAVATTGSPTVAGNAAAIDAGVKSVLATRSITFLPNDARLTPEGLATVDAVADAIGTAPVSIEVRGYTDDNGSPNGNLRISQRRAQAVKDRLVQKGLSSRSISARGLGEADPVADNTTPDGQARNRRIEIDVTPKQ